MFEMFVVSTSNFCSPWNDPRICILLKEVMEVLCKLTRETKAIFGLCSTHVSKLIYGTDINNLRENYKQDRLFQTRSKLQSHFSRKSFFGYLKDTLNIITIWRELLGLTGMYSFHLILITWWGTIHPDTNITSTIFI